MSRTCSWLWIIIWNGDEVNHHGVMVSMSCDSVFDLTLLTSGAIGTMEMVSSTAMCGLIYALSSAQPLTIIGSTGPVLAFVATLVQFANKAGLPFLPLYAWTGIWTSGILLASSVTSASNLVKYLTRFTDEIFSCLISFIFVIEAAQNIGKSFSSTFAKGLLTLTVAVTTYTAATMLRGLRNTVYFTKGIRKNVSNFGPTLGVVAGALVARWAKLSQGAEAALPALAIPQTFATTSGRPWLVPLADLPVWARWGAFFPALMATVLLFLDQNITVRLVNNPQYKMEKGRRKNDMLDGMHADMLVISVLTFATSLLGLPWLVAATVRSISHVRALSVFTEGGKLKSTIEQRITGLSIHGLIGACVLFDAPRSVLTQIPTPVLMGLFMFLGTSALPGNEMWERIKGLFKDASVAPKERWSAVPRKTTKLFTAIQVLCLAAMVYVKVCFVPSRQFHALLCSYVPSFLGISHWRSLPGCNRSSCAAEICFGEDRDCQEGIHGCPRRGLREVLDQHEDIICSSYHVLLALLSSYHRMYRQ